MTLTISFRLLAFLIYTVALLGGAFAVSVVVSDWRDDDAIVTTTETTTGLSQTEAQNIAHSEAQRAARFAVCVSGEFTSAALSGIAEGQAQNVAEGITSRCESQTNFSTRGP